MKEDQREKSRLPHWGFMLLGIPLIVVCAPIVIGCLLIRLLFDCLVLMAVWAAWLPRGKDTLIVYSDSPNWRDYFASIVAPAIGERSWVINWSQRKQWRLFDLRALAFRCFAGAYEYNPIVIVFKPLRWPRRFRFYRAMRDVKHRNFATVREVVKKLSNYLKQPVAAPAAPPEPT